MNETRRWATTSATTIRSLIGAIRWRRCLSRVLLVMLPVALALVGYYRAQLAGAPLPRPQGDAAFYAYQLRRAAECHGQWWRIAADDRLGHPYPSEFAKHPGLFEGVDLMLLASLFAGAVSAAWAYHLAALTALTVNGWIAAWIVLKITRSTLWAVVAVALVTLNESVAVRVLVHLHLFKFAWVLLAVWTFVKFLKQPAWWRGLLLGLAVALELQSSFYLGFFTGLGLGFSLCSSSSWPAEFGATPSRGPFWRPWYLLARRLSSAFRSGQTTRQLSDLIGTSIAIGPRPGSMERRCGSISFPKTRGWPQTTSGTFATRRLRRSWTKGGTSLATRFCWRY